MGGRGSIPGSPSPSMFLHIILVPAKLKGRGRENLGTRLETTNLQGKISKFFDATAFDEAQVDGVVGLCRDALGDFQGSRDIADLNA